MEVAQIDGHTWAVSTRGFNMSASNKMQVLMDGRSLYTPLFSGVFWDVQQTFLPDLEQIEIIRGPGATLWGANAVNGVINIRTKSAEETQGLLLYGGGGFENDGFGGIRYGGKIGDDTYYRVYVMNENGDGLPLEGDGNEDSGHIIQGGFRVDSKCGADDTLTVQGDFYAGNFDQLTNDDIDVDGQNVLGRWTHRWEKDSSSVVQAYYDRTHRLVPGTFEEERNTFDIDLQHQFRYDQHYIVVGGNYRLSHDDIGNLGPSLAFIPDSDTQHLVSGYIQDEWHIVPDKFHITAGSKFEYNSFSGFEIQPTARFTWLPSENQTVWAAISRAVRTPSRIDQDLVAPNPAFGAPLLIANPDFESEKLIAYELGYRIKPADNLSFDIAGYYNDYDDLRSVEPVPNGQFTIQNKLDRRILRRVDCREVASQKLVADRWQRFAAAGRRSTANPAATTLTTAPVKRTIQIALSSCIRAWTCRGMSSSIPISAIVNDLPNPATPSYLTADARVAWSPGKDITIAIVGRNLFDDAHPGVQTRTR